MKENSSKENSLKENLMKGIPMKVVVAPDSFKGSMSSRQLCTIMSAAIRALDPVAEVIEVPLSDGGEGTVDCLVHATNGKLITAQATSPSGGSVEAAYGVLGDGETAVIEVAAASGLTLVPEAERHLLTATSFGTGELIVDALHKGFKRFIIGLGGSGINDGGMGMLRALGVEFYDQHGQPLPEGGGALIHLAHIDTSRMNPLIYESQFTIASDVDNPLCGPQGASYIFGPQKGATPDMVEQLDAALTHYSSVVLEQLGIDMQQIRGGGAAGGLGAAFGAFLRGNMTSGIETMLQAVDWDEQITGAQLIMTGEGQLDQQTLHGKTIQGVCKSARQHNIPVVALAGSVQLTTSELDELGVTSAFSIVPGPASLEEAIENAAPWVQHTTEQVYRLFNRGMAW